MLAVAEHFITEDEYLQMEATASIKHEYFNGCIYAMVGGSNTHAVLCTNVVITAGSRLRGRECRAVGSEQRVKIEATGLLTYPDAAIYCPPTRFEGRHNETLLTPRLIVEVLSPSTERYDRTTKFEHYEQMESLMDYILIGQDRVLVQHYQRQPNGGWLLRSYTGHEQQVELPDLGITLPLTELYDGVEVPAGLPPLREDGTSSDDTSPVE